MLAGNHWVLRIWADSLTCLLSMSTIWTACQFVSKESDEDILKVKMAPHDFLEINDRDVKIWAVRQTH